MSKAVSTLFKSIYYNRKYIGRILSAVEQFCTVHMDGDSGAFIGISGFKRRGNADFNVEHCRDYSF